MFVADLKQKLGYSYLQFGKGLTVINQLLNTVVTLPKEIFVPLGQQRVLRELLSKPHSAPLLLATYKRTAMRMGLLASLPGLATPVVIWTFDCHFPHDSLSCFINLTIGQYV